MGIIRILHPPHGIFLSIDGFEFNTDPTNIDFWVQIGNDEGLHHDFYQVRSWNNIFLSNGIPGPLFVENIWWSLVDPSGSALSSDVLPPTPPVVGNWQDNVLGITGPKQIFEVRARVTLAIPEPGTILLFGVGGLIFRLKKKNKRKFQAFF